MDAPSRRFHKDSPLFPERALRADKAAETEVFRGRSFRRRSDPP